MSIARVSYRRSFESPSVDNDVINLSSEDLANVEIENQTLSKSAKHVITICLIIFLVANSKLM
jgi:hypothetical protein